MRKIAFTIGLRTTHTQTVTPEDIIEAKDGTTLITTETITIEMTTTTTTTEGPIVHTSFMGSVIITTITTTTTTRTTTIGENLKGIEVDMVPVTNHTHKKP